MVITITDLCNLQLAVIQGNKSRTENNDACIVIWKKTGAVETARAGVRIVRKHLYLILILNLAYTKFIWNSNHKSH